MPQHAARRIRGARGEYSRTVDGRHYQVIIQSIYPECVSSRRTENLLRLEIPIEFCGSRSVRVISPTDNPDDSASLLLSTLPPLLLQLSFPPNYPISSPPTIVSLHATHHWLPGLSQLQYRLNCQWQPGQAVLYDWTEYVRTGGFLSDLDMLNEDKSAIQFV
jgi:E3 ubiquitin-protein ligase RNF14